MIKVFWLIVFTLSMALVEAAVVIYLRDIYYPDGFAFPLKILSEKHLTVEIAREAATIFMLISVAAFCGTRFWEKFSYFIICFGFWDLFYYVWLNILIGWPSSLIEWDVLFLIPLPWIGPVVAPMIVAATMLIIGFFILFLYKIGYSFVPSLISWILVPAGTTSILYSFMADYGATLHQKIPLPYRYELLLIGELLYFIALFFAWKNTARKNRTSKHKTHNK